jgi:beta-aspartyl-dipeptidase (metallo-type)
MTGKAGVVHLHLGDGPRGLASCAAPSTRSRSRRAVWNPTHVNRRRALFDEAVALAAAGARST